MIPGFVLRPLAQAGDKVLDTALAVTFEIVGMTWQYVSKRIDR